MDANTISLVKETFATVETIKDKAAEMFYNRLFEIRPDFRSLFKTDMMFQGQKLMGAIKMAVDNLDDLTPVVEEIQNLGRRHVGYGVKDEYYQSVGEALLWTLEQGLGESFTDEVKKAWSDVYTLLSGTMKDAAEGNNA